MASFYKDNPDLQWYVDQGIDWTPVAELAEAGFRHPDGFKSTEEAVQFYRDVFELVGTFSAEKIAPVAAEIDREGVHFDVGEVKLAAPAEKIMKEVAKLGLHGLTVPRSLGGMGCPLLVYMIASELLARGDVSLMSHIGFCGGMAAALMYYSIMEGSATVDGTTGDVTACRFDKEIKEILAGKAWGSMDLTEPDAGSDLANLRSKAVLGEDGTWRVTGQKIFITSGHAKYHIVLARTEPVTSTDDPLAGLQGLSLFLVPAFSGTGARKTWHATFDRVEEKLGHHGSPTVAITFSDSPAQLIGQRGEGFKQMLLLMNNARLAVAFESLGLGEAAYRMARDYAAERMSMGKSIDRHELIAEYLDGMRTDLQAMRAVAITGAWHEELSRRYQLARDHAAGDDDVARARFDKLHKKHRDRARWLTPLAKYQGSEKAVEMARMALQIHGGVGYTKEYGAEKLLRDALVFPIYEGTSQIQALMAMKDTLGGILKNPQAFVRRTAQARWRSLSSRDPLERRVAKIQSQSLAAQQHLIQRTATDKIRGLAGVPVTKWADTFLKNWDPKKDFAFARLHAERLTRLLIEEATVRILWGQAKRDASRREVLARYLDRAEPIARDLLDRITNGSDRILGELSEREADAAQG
ncbi:MAG: acyl-CoA dehydrogenase family protein [bacterium]